MKNLFRNLPGLTGYPRLLCKLFETQKKADSRAPSSALAPRTRGMSEAPQSPLGLSALEEAMGVVHLAGADDHFDGEIEPEDPETPPSGRTPVTYEDSGLFSPGLDVAPSSSEALLSHLETLASQLEAQSGEHEIGIREKINTLRTVLKDQPAFIEQQRRRLDEQAGGSKAVSAAAAAAGAAAAADAADVADAADAADSADAAAAAAARVAAESVASIEAGMEEIGSLLEDKETVAMLAQTKALWLPALGPRQLTEQ